MTKKEKEAQSAEAVTELKKLLQDSDSVYVSMVSVSSSGMYRTFKLFIARDNTIINITWYAGRALGSGFPLKEKYGDRVIGVGGCGMDMGWHLVESLGYTLKMKLRAERL